MCNTILYVEDDPALAHVTALGLKRRGYKIKHVSTIESAQQALEATQFSYALLDLKIGNQTSLELLQQIKQQRNIPIVVLTGYGTIRTAVHAMKLGAIDFISKPCGIEEIISALENTKATVNNKPALEKQSLKSIERESIQKALDDNDGNISAAARQLKMHRRSLQRKLNKRHIDLN